MTKKQVKKVENKDEKKWQFKCYSGLFKKLIARVGQLYNEIELNISKEGISTIVVDPAHVALAKLDIPKKDFYTGHSAVNKDVSYKVKEEFSIGIDLDKLTKTLKLMNNYDYVTGYVLGNTLYLDTDRIHKKIQLLDTAGIPNAKVPNLKFDVKAKISSSDIGLLMRAVSDETEYLTLISDGKELYTIIEEDEDNLKIDLSNNVKGKGKALYSCDYFGNIVSDIGSKVIMEFSTDQPVRITGDVYDSGKFEYLLAPRIESE